MIAGFHFRKAAEADIAALGELQQAAYTENRGVMGVEPMPLQADYTAVCATMDVWVVERDDSLKGALILAIRPDDLLIWSIATHPTVRHSGIGRALLAFAEQYAIQQGRSILRLYTGEKLVARVEWYGRHGFSIERIEDMGDRRAVHMMKTLG